MMVLVTILYHYFQFPYTNNLNEDFEQGNFTFLLSYPFASFLGVLNTCNIEILKVTVGFLPMNTSIEKHAMIN